MLLCFMRCLSLPRACDGGRRNSEDAWLQTAVVPQACCILPRMLDNEVVGIVATVWLSKVTDNQFTLTSAASAVKSCAQTSAALPLKPVAPC